MRNIKDLFNVNEDIFDPEIGAEGLVGMDLGGYCFIEKVEGTTAYVDYKGGKYWKMELDYKNYKNFIDLYPKIKKFVFENDVYTYLNNTDLKNIPIEFEKDFSLNGTLNVSNLNLTGKGPENRLWMTCGKKGNFKKVKINCTKARLDFDGQLGLSDWHRAIPDDIEIKCNDLYIVFKSKGIGNSAYEYAVKHYTNSNESEKDKYNKFLKEIKEDVFKEINLDPKKIKFKEIHFDADSYPNERYKSFKQNFTWNELKKA